MEIAGSDQTGGNLDERGGPLSAIERDVCARKCTPVLRALYNCFATIRAGKYHRNTDPARTNDHSGNNLKSTINARPSLLPDSVQKADIRTSHSLFRVSQTQPPSLCLYCFINYRLLTLKTCCGYESYSMATPREPDDTEIDPGKCRTQSPDWQTPSSQIVKADEDNTQRDLSSRMPQRSAFPEIHDQAQNAPATSEGASGHQPGHPGHRTSAEYQQHHYHADTSDPSHHLTNAQPSGLWSHNSRQPADTQPSGLASLPESSKDVPVMPQVPASYALQAPPNHLSALVQPTPHQPLHVGFPPYAMFGHQSTNHVYPNPPANVSLALLPNVISWVDERTVRDYLAIAVVRHKDIHDMVEREYGRIVKEHQDRKNEDASVLSFVNEHTKVQRVLCQEYDDLPNPKKQETVLQTLGTIKLAITAIPPRVRPGSNWKTKSNAFVTLIWIGRGIADGRGMLPNAIRAQLHNSSGLVEALGRVYAMMSAAEILNDGARLLKHLLELERSREHCFEGLERIVDMFQRVMRQGRVG